MSALAHGLCVVLLAQASGSSPAGGSGSGAWSYAIAGALLIAAVIFFFLEIVLPSGGVLSLLAAACLLGGVVMCFRIDTTLGLASATLALLAIPVALAIALKVAPETPVFRMLALKAEQTPVLRSARRRSRQDGDAEDGAEADEANAGDDEPESLVGVTGEALTELRPVGACRLGDRREECLAASGLIEKGTPIVVVSHDGMQIKVRPRDE